MIKLGFIGAGNMAYAIVGGICHSDLAEAQIHLYDVDKSKYDRFDFENIVREDNLSFAKVCDYLFLCAKPQNFPGVLASLNGQISKDCVIVTIAAGISIQTIIDGLGFPAKVVRVMPNTPLLLSAGASALSIGEAVKEEEAQFVFSIFEKLGCAVRIDENQMNAIIPVNGSSPAYIYLFIKAMADASVHLGISYETAITLICATVKGSVKMVEESGYTPDELIKMVSSPGGTTLKALEVFKQAGFEEIIEKAMIACKNRADELSTQ